MQPTVRAAIATFMCLVAGPSFAAIITSGIASGSVAVGYPSDIGRPSGHTYNGLDNQADAVIGRVFQK